MTPYELLDLILSLSNRLDTHWTLFITVHLALIGGIIYVDRPLNRKEKIVATFVYSGFAYINYAVMKRQFDFLGSIYEKLYLMKDDACCINNPVMDYMVESYGTHISTTSLYSILIVHLAMFVIVIASIFYDGSKSDIVDGKSDLDS